MINSEDIRWLTPAQIEAKIRLGLKGAVGKLYDSRDTSLDFNTAQFTSTYTSSSPYIPSNRAISSLTASQALLVYHRFKKESKTESLERIEETTPTYGANVSLSFFGLIYLDTLYTFRFARRENNILQIWFIVEGADDFNIGTDPIINYLTKDILIGYDQV